MMSILLFAATAAGPAVPVVGYDQLMIGNDRAAITAIEGHPTATPHPAQLLNLGIAYARQGDEQRARALFETVLQTQDRVELETSTGAWVDSVVLARRALAMLDQGVFAAGGRLARK